MEMNKNLYVRFLVSVWMIEKVNLFYKCGRKIKIELFFGNNQIKFQPRT